MVNFVNLVWNMIKGPFTIYNLPGETRDGVYNSMILLVDGNLAHVAHV